VSLLAFNRIVERYPHLIAVHEDVIMSCLDDADVSIRLRALDLVVGMVNSDNLTQIVDNLLRQLKNSPIDDNAHDLLNDRGAAAGVQPSSEWDDEDVVQSIKPAQKRSAQAAPLPDDYRHNIIQRILEMCSRNTYANVADFDWYIDTLVSLVRHVPPPAGSRSAMHDSLSVPGEDVAVNIGVELQNIAIRVKSARTDATRAAEMLIAIDQRARLFPSSHNGGQGVLEHAVWIAGEFARHLQSPESTLDSLSQASTQHLPPRILGGYVQAAVKILTFILSDTQCSWTPERKNVVALTIAKVVHFLESLTTHPNLEIQERAVEYLELGRLASEATSAHDASSDYGNLVEPPPLFTQALPALFSGVELNPVARDAQRKVPVPEGLDLEKPINANLSSLLAVGQLDMDGDADNEFDIYYNERPKTVIRSIEPAAARLQEAEVSYQQSNGEKADPEAAAKRRAERRERHKDDPFYIPSEDNSGTSTPYNVLRSTNGETLDVDSIPIMELKLESDELREHEARAEEAKRKKKTARRKVEILTDENIADDDLPDSGPSTMTTNQSLRPPLLSVHSSTRSPSPLKVDSSNLGAFSLNPPGASNTRGNSGLDSERQEAEEAEMAAAMKEVERMRLEMQRKAETIEAPNGGEGTVVRRKAKKKKPIDANGDGSLNEKTGEKPKKKKSKKPKLVDDGPADETSNAVSYAAVDIAQPVAVESNTVKEEVQEQGQESEPKAKKKVKRRTVTFDND
jgi:AP-3 complex subunit delta-1